MSASDDRRKWPDVERRAGQRRTGSDRRLRDRRSGLDRRNEASWVPVPVDSSDRGDDELIDRAAVARQQARAPYSGFKVGAALQLADGAVVTGCNIENATYGLTVCAERVALLKALSDGHAEFRRIAIVADTQDPTPPCGPCRQLLWEYCGDIDVVMANLKGPTARYSLSALLPLPFDRRLLR